MEPVLKTIITITKRLLPLFILFAGAALIVRVMQAPSTAQTTNSEERKLRVSEFKNMPLEVREIRNLQSETWYKDLEIEVKNVSDKPIYFILAFLMLPDDKSFGNGASGIGLPFGERKNIDIRRYADPQDPHLDPGGTLVFTIPEKLRKGLRDKHETIREITKNLALEFQVISFGDGTGFVGDQPRDHRSKRAHANSKKNLPSNRLEGSASAEPPSQDGCGICHRYIIRTHLELCFGCERVYADTSPEMPCARIKTVFFFCESSPAACYSEIIDFSESLSCPIVPPSSTPTSTQTPSPSPTPTPFCPPPIHVCLEAGGVDPDT